MVFVWLLVTILSVFYFWLNRRYTHWQRLEVPGPKPSWFLGNFGPMLKSKEHYGEVATNWYKYVNNLLKYRALVINKT